MHSNIFLLFVSLYLFATVTALAFKSIASEDASSIHKHDVRAIAGQVYHNVQRHIGEAVAPVSVTATTKLNIESVDLSESDIDKRTKTRGKGGASKRSNILEERAKTRGGGGAGKRAEDLKARTKIGLKVDVGRRSVELKERTKTRPNGGAGRRSVILEERTKTRGNGGASKRSDTLEVRTKTRGDGGAGR